MTNYLFYLTPSFLDDLPNISENEDVSAKFLYPWRPSGYELTLEFSPSAAESWFPVGQTPGDSAPLHAACQAADCV